MKKLFSALLAAPAALLFASPAAAIPPPDRIIHCPGAPQWQIHVWDLLYGIPNSTSYLYMNNYADYTQNGASPSWTAVSSISWSHHCKSISNKPGPFVIQYEEAKPNIFVPKPTTPGRPILRGDKEAAKVPALRIP